jgi:phosphatidylserine/phosphatidylglycerophosphate/cardiolipin synthase-like enzyme
MKTFLKSLTVAAALSFTTLGSTYAQTPQGYAFPPGASWENGFTIDGTALPLILKLINSAHQQILVAAYAFSNREITSALIRAHQNGVQVYVVADEKENQKFTTLGYLVKYKIPVRLTNHYAIMHNKFMIVDGVNLETGSFNYTQSAVTQNAENVLVNWNFPQEAQNYTRDWKAIWDGGYDYHSDYQ